MKIFRTGATRVVGRRLVPILRREPRRDGDRAVAAIAS
jgi:hypothetical protein